MLDRFGLSSPLAGVDDTGLHHDLRATSPDHRGMLRRYRADDLDQE